MLEIEAVYSLILLQSDDSSMMKSNKTKKKLLKLPEFGVYAKCSHAALEIQLKNMCSVVSKDGKRIVIM